ncbi:hypothetical protein [Ekhidna sp.]
MGDIAVASTQFIYENRFNPFDLADKKAVVDVVRDLKNQTIKYLQTQEKQLIKPTATAINQLTGQVGELIAAVQASRPAPEPEKPVKPPIEPEKPVTSPLQSILERKEKQLGKNFQIMNEIKAAFTERKGVYSINLPKSRVDDLLEEFFSS